MKLVSFRLGEEWFAIGANLCLKVRRHTDITPIAAAPPHIAGLASINGQVATVLLLEDVLRLPPGAAVADRCCVILKPERDEEHLTGFLVDAPVDIVECDGGDIKAPYRLGESAAAGHVRGLLTHKGRVLRILNMEGILTESEGERT